MTVSTSFRVQNGATSHVSDGQFASPWCIAFGTGAEHVVFVIFIVYIPSVAFHTPYFTNGTSTLSSMPLLSHLTGHLFAVPRRFTRATSAHRTVLCMVTRIVHAVAHASHVTFQSQRLTIDFGPSQKVLAALLCVRWDGEAPAQPTFLPKDLRAPSQASGKI
ncbi:hypothetical protein B0H14DRAFT_3508411 [Mycena olivaceomarginata]|nr:hypothetical protein B0H14DRAFT_3508411 [Mycena olivaceomarginata]